MKVELKDFLDTSKLSEEEVKNLEGLVTCIDSVVESRIKGFLKDEVKIEDLRTSISEAMKSVESLKKEGDKAVDKDVFENRMNDINEALIRMKSATEVKDGEIRLKSIEQQVEEQLKEFITNGKNGQKAIDLKAACKSSPGFKKTLDLVISSKAVPTVASAGVTPSFTTTLDRTLSVDPRAQSVIRDHANVATISTRSLTYAEFVPGEGDAAWVPEGGLKPATDASLREVTINAGKVALTCKLTDEALTDLPQLVAEIRAEIISRIGLAEEAGILNGTGTGGEIKGVAADIPGFSLTGLKIKSPSIMDVIVAGYTQILSTSNMAYRPNLVLMNPLDYAMLMREKDTTGRPLNERLSDVLPQGLSIVTSTAIAQGEIWIGDFTYLNIRDLWSLQITFGWENDDFTKNLVTMIGEKRLMAYIKAQYKTAFVKDDIDTIIEAITPGTTSGGGDTSGD